MKFGDYIRDRRAALGWTQPEAAAKAGIEQSYLSKLENGRSTPSADVYARICEAYEIEHAALYAAIDDASIQELMDIEQIRTLAAARALRSRSEAKLWRIAGVIAFGLGAGLLGASQVAPTEESRFVYQSAGLFAEEQPSRLAADRDPSQPDQIEEQTRSQVEYRGPTFTEPVEGGRRSWNLVGGETVTLHAWTRWLAIPGLIFLFSGAASVVNGWRKS